MNKNDYEARAKVLHQLAVDWHTIRKDLLNMGRHIEHLVSVTQPGPGGGHFACHSAHQSLNHLRDSCLFWSGWVDSYIQRTSIRIDLVS